MGLDEGILLVGDIENIRRIFHAKYGSEVDFSGYIDKFYSKEVFKFNNHGIYEDVIDSLSQSITAMEEDYKHATTNFFNLSRRDVWKELMMALVGVEVLNLRKLLKFYQQEIKIKVDKKIVLLENRLFYAENHYSKHPSVIFFVSLMSFFDSADDLLLGLEKIKGVTKEFYIRDFKKSINFFLVMLDHKNTSFKEGEYSYKDIVNNLDIKYHIQSRMHDRDFFAYIAEINNWDTDTLNVSLNHYIFETAKILVDLKVIK